MRIAKPESPSTSALRVGIEVELLMPPARSRQDLATAVANKVGGSVTTGWHLDSEPSAHKKLDVFQHLTPSFTVKGPRGQTVATFVSDVTIRAGLDAKAGPVPGWSRVLSDDPRILRILANLLRPQDRDIKTIAEALAPLGLACEQMPEAVKVVDSADSSVALVADVRGETSRVAECISPPLTDGVDGWLDLVVGTAAELGASEPREGATHVHFDAGIFSNPEVFQRLVWVFSENHEELRKRFDTNPNCRRLGPLPEGLKQLANSDEYEAMDWEQIKQKALAVEGLTKYADVNVLHLLSPKPRLDTVEFRALPTSTDPAYLRHLVSSLTELVSTLIAPESR